jgi:hypothetical protein
MATSVGGEHPMKINHNFCGLNLADESYFEEKAIKINKPTEGYAFHVVSVTL